MSVVGVGIINKRGERRRCLPLEIRTKVYNDVIKLGKQGLTYKEIQEKLFEKYKVQLCMKNIYNWINGKHHPFGNVSNFDGNPSPELGYVIGAMLGDGCLYFDGGNYLLWLRVNDKEYAEEFGRCLAKILGKKKPYKPFWNKNRKQWIVVVCAVQLFKLLDRPLEELKPYIEYSKETVASFLRALFDAEGSIYVKIKGDEKERQLCLYNTDEKLLSYIQRLLKGYFDIDSTLYLIIKKGSIKHFPNGKIAKTTKNYYLLYIHARSLLNFYKHIGFTIKRKQQTLIKAIKYFSSPPSF
jgi:intein-encoded DNA endonuclease-like protein